MNPDLEKMASEYEKAAKEFEEAAKHCKVAAKHFKDQEVPRGCAHAYAALGHQSVGGKILVERAEFHSTKARSE